MDERPKQRIWNGDDYESDAEEDKSRHRSSDADALHYETVDIRSDISYLMVLYCFPNPIRSISTSAFFYPRRCNHVLENIFRCLLGGIGDIPSLVKPVTLSNLDLSKSSNLTLKFPSSKDH